MMLLVIKLRVDVKSENLHHMSKGVLGLMLFFIALIVSTGVASATIITVDDSGSKMHTSIQAAIDDASPGDEIHVDSGTYYENVVVNKQLTLRGFDTGAGVPVVDAGGSGSTITLSADGVTLEGFKATGAGLYPNAGIKVTSNNNTLSGNTASNNTYYGILLPSSSNNTLSDNTASNNDVIGISLSSSSNNTLNGNTASNNDATGISLSSSNNNTLNGNTASNNTYYGILLSSSSNNTLSGNTASNNTRYGIGLISSNNNTLSGNTASNNTKYGILLIFSNNNTLSGNTASNNTEYGILLSSSSNNILYHNNLIDNTINAKDDSNNKWESGTEGNYYSDYTGTDSNNDGIGDTPYPIPGGSSVDNYPLESTSISSPVHNINKSTDYTTIQTAIDDASPGDEIHVDSGTYYENVVVDQTIILKGIDIGTGMPIIDGSFVSSTITINVQGVTIDGFEITHSSVAGDGAGIKINDGYSKIINNTIIRNGGDGIFARGWRVNITGNNISYNEQMGIWAPSSKYMNISKNIFITTEYNDVIYMGLHYGNNIINENKIYGGYRGIILWGNDYNEVKYNEISNVIIGIDIGQSNFNEIIENNLHNNSVGLELRGRSNRIIANNISNNEKGIDSNSIYSYDNILYHNNLVENTINAEDYNNNNWDSGTIGNYYSDYTGTDSDGDGIGDTPYPIPGGSSVDKYPLMASYSPTLPPTIQDKSLLQVEGQPEVYWLQNGKLYWVTDWDVISKMSGIPGWDSVNTLSASEFNPADYPQGPSFITTGPESDGLLIMEVGDYKVYLIENVKKRHITYPDVMDLKGYSFDDVIEVSSEISNMFQIGDPLGIEVDLYFNKAGSSGEFSQFMSGDTVISIIDTTLAEDYNVETYVKRIKPDGTIQYTYYEKVDFQISDSLQFSDTERPLYPGTWHTQTKTWSWNEYAFSGNEMEGIYTWEFWYKDASSGNILGKDVQGYEFSKTPSNQVDIFPPDIVLITPSDVTFNNEGISAIAYDSSGIETSTVTLNGQVISLSNGPYLFSGMSHSIDYPFVNLNAGINEITISARDNSENHNERIETWTIIHYPFSVQMPYQLDRYTPEEFTTLNGKIIGGTPPFVYKWKVNDDIYSETSNKYNIQYPLTEILESGKYNIQLEVTDDQGYTINVEEKQIIISPLNVGSTFGFRPNPNGYQFRNFARDDYSWEMFRNTYGANQVELSDGTNNSIAENFYNSFKFRHAGRSFTCFGISASSLVTYQEDDGTNNYRSWDLGDDRNNSLPSWSFFPSFVSTTQDWTEYYQPLQHSEAAVSDKVIYNNPIAVYDELKLSMASVWIDDPIVIGMEWGTAGHAVVPYKIEEAADHRTGKVFIYDNNNLPGEEGHFILFDLETNTAKNEEYNGGNDLDNVRAIKLSSVQNEKTPLRIPNLESVTSNGDLLYEDSVARHYGFYEGVFEDEIPGVTQIINWNQDEYNQFLETYYISDLNLKRELYGVDDGVATVSISRPNSLVIADVQVSPNSVDEINVPEDGSSVEFISGEGTPALSLMLDRENTEFARIVRITGSEIESGNGVQISFSDDLSKISIINKGLPHGYDLYLEQIGSNPSSYNNLIQIIVEENSAVWITPLDWNDIDNNAILIEYDSGNDGTIELSEMINTYNITFLPPITTMDQFNLTDGSTLPIKFTARNSTIDEFIYDDTINVTITNSTGNLISYFTNGTGMDSVRINSTEEQYIVNFHSMNYDLKVGETYAVTVTFGESESFRGYDMTYFRLVEGGKAKGKGKGN